MPTPTPRETLTSLLTTLFALPPSQQATAVTIDSSTHGPPLPPHARLILTTLHVLIPPPTLLQAFDLLDRQLVTRLNLSNKDSGRKGAGEAAAADAREAHGDEAYLSGGSSSAHARTAVYVVRSAQQAPSLHRWARSQIRHTSSTTPSTTDLGPTSTSHFGRTLSSSTSYLVRLDAWNCSCAAFAFAAFPGSLSDGSKANWLRGRTKRRRGGTRQDPMIVDAGNDIDSEMVKNTPSEIRGENITSGFIGTAATARRYHASGSSVVTKQSESEDERWWEDGPDREDNDGSTVKRPQDIWSFGGMSLDGLDPFKRRSDASTVGGGGEAPGNVPCCKHLLACLIGDRWPGVLGTYVNEMSVTREELAGACAEI